MILSYSVQTYLISIIQLYRTLVVETSCCLITFVMSFAQKKCLFKPLHTCTWSAVPTLLSFVFEKERAISRNGLVVCVSPNGKVHSVLMMLLLMKPGKTFDTITGIFCDFCPQRPWRTYIYIYSITHKCYTVAQYQTAVIKITCLGTLGNHFHLSWDGWELWESVACFLCCAPKCVECATRRIFDEDQFRSLLSLLNLACSLGWEEQHFQHVVSNAQMYV